MFDVRFAAEGVKFTFAFSKRGLIAEYGSSWLLPRLMGTSRALDLLMSSRVITVRRGVPDGPRQQGGAQGGGGGRGDGLRPRPGPQLLAGVDGHHQAPGVRPPDARRRRGAVPEQRLHAPVAQGPDFKEGVRQLRREAAAGVRRRRGHRSRASGRAAAPGGAGGRRPRADARRPAGRARPRRAVPRPRRRRVRPGQRRVRPGRHVPRGRVAGAGRHHRRPLPRARGAATAATW